MFGRDRASAFRKIPQRALNAKLDSVAVLLVLDAASAWIENAVVSELEKNYNSRFKSKRIEGAGWIDEQCVRIHGQRM